MESSEIAGWIVGIPMMGFMIGYFIVWIVKDIKRSRKQGKIGKNIEFVITNFFNVFVAISNIS